MKLTKFIFNSVLCFLLGWPLQTLAQTSAPASTVPEVEWYPPEIDRSRIPERARVIISGRTQPESKISIDGDTVTLLKAKTSAPPVPESSGQEPDRTLRANCRVYELPDLNSKALTSLSKGTKIRVSDFSERWMKVNFAKASGFISKACFVPMKNQTGGLSQSDASKGVQDNSKIDSRETRANEEGFFELLMDLPQGLVQVPVSVSNSKGQKTFLLSIDVSLQNIRLAPSATTKMAEKKPPAAGKKLRIWGGLGLTYQTYSQTTTGSSDVAFQTVQAPGILARAGYWGDDWGIDFYFRDAPGKIEAEQPFLLQTDTYHWRTMEAKGLYQFSRGPTSRLLGLPSQWQLRFGSQVHQIPFLDIDASNNINVRTHTLTMGTLGVGLLLAQEQDWSYEFALGMQIPVSSSGSGNEFVISSPVPLEAQIGAAYKVAPNWRVGLFSYIQSHKYSYEFTNDAGTVKTGTQNLFYTTFDLRLGYEY